MAATDSGAISISSTSNYRIFIGRGSGISTAYYYAPYSIFDTSYSAGLPVGLSVDTSQSGSTNRFFYKKPGTTAAAQYRTDTSSGLTNSPGYADGTIYTNSAKDRIYWVANNRIWYKNDDGTATPA